MMSGYWNKVTALPGKGWDYAQDNKVKTAVGVGSAIVVVSFVAACLAFPAYRGQVATLTASAIADISGGFAAAFKFAAANPIAFGLLAIAAVAAIGVLAVKSYNQANQLGEVRNDLSEKEAQLGKVREQAEKAFEEKRGADGNLVLKDAGTVQTVVSDIAAILKVGPKVAGVQ